MKRKRQPKPDLPPPLSLTIVPSGEVFEMNGAKGRIWDGWTAGGEPCRVLVFGIQVAADADTAEFDAALKEMPVTLIQVGPGSDLIDPEQN